ncbi:BirA family transcriptional regulator, biotin operon repressor / biotin-[acetyl-CoA-carboxylase] ligase [endosymbiont of Bathymodiolus septemdierum str. Myojin knoll]|uniref:BirA family transcriptional regulator, biotin operon repressor / biotin-[acetyl-CoA-carboxylase] ligase n=2 Tax=sulfur-oxidizing symbionts TaxID=32036 RepID=A0A0P0UTW5_9GAMM|nr:BirA family transcriptional regulator, biotin operon repressor / biotin-[acetyl-CoA-carboxylase] ligase [endosymbiont of Bathymodiolus septemdierum str. Myojin knoll]
MVNYSDLTAHLSGDIDCHIFDTLPSTNDYLSSLAFSPRTQVCVAMQQTQGKGQYNRRWLSSKNNSILLSIRRVFSADVTLSGLSLVVGLALIETLKDYGINDLQLKWPNDVYHQDKKLAGILIENSLKNQMQSVVIGLGINVDVDIDCQTPWTDLRTISKNPINQFDLNKDLINKILQFCQIFADEGFVYFTRQWENVDYLHGKRLQYDDKKQTFLGLCCGVNAEGALLIKTKREIKRVYSSQFLSFPC